MDAVALAPGARSTLSHVARFDILGACWIVSSWLPIDRGILVDDYLCTGFPGVYATGDCAQIYHPEISDYWVSIGHENACLLGRIAAINLIGGDKRTKVKPESIFSVKGINVNTSWWVEF